MMNTMRQVVTQSQQGLKPTNVAHLMKRTSSLYRLVGDNILQHPHLQGIQKRCLAISHTNKHNDLLREVANLRGLFLCRTLSTTAAQDASELPPRIKPWKTHMVESQGDYRDEAFLEKDDAIGGPLYRNQTSLPKLPIPSITETIERFLPTALPLARTEEEAKALKSACDAFPKEAAKLHERLTERRENEMKESSWLQLWWNQLGYLQVRDSIVVNVSYFFQFQDDPSIVLGSDKSNVQCAAKLLFLTAEFRNNVCSGAMEPETIGKAQIPLDSTAFKYMFNACRIPRRVQDTYRIYDPSRFFHAIVARKGNFFAIDIVDRVSGKPLPVSVLEDQLHQCIELADAIPPSRPKLGILTTTNRDNWADAREKLLNAGGKPMEKALEVLESGAVLVNLDDSSLTDRVECSEMFLTGRQLSGDNRWFDKSIQLIVQNNGRAGCTNEHSMMDGMPTVKYVDYINKTPYAEVKEKSKNFVAEPHQAFDIFGEALEGTDLALLQGMENEARQEFHQNIGKQSTSVLTYESFGSDFIKKSGNPPDAFVQVAMQLATYRLFGEQAGSYEATQVRRFLHGRTEVTRAVSLESEAFVKRMGMVSSKNDGIESRKEKLDLLRKATASHSTYSQFAAQALGVDRHFFGLSMMMDGKENAPALYSDPVFNRSKWWRVSTSNLSHPKIVNWGFGQVVEDGVGIAYSIHPGSCVFNISALATTGWTPKLAQLLEESLDEMQWIAQVELGGDDSQPVSKL